MNTQSFLSEMEKLAAGMTRRGGYREGGSFTHDGVRYDLDTALRRGERRRTRRVSTGRLSWVLGHDTPTEARVARADTSAPVLLARSRDGRLTVVDGLHRLAGALRSGQRKLPAKVLTPRDLELSKIASYWSCSHRVRS
jgi:hypothetical protein